jgi:hypothetical protein
LADLPDRQRTIMCLLVLDGLSQQEVAEQLGMTANAVRASIFKARRKLEKVLGRTRAGQLPEDALTSATGRVSLPTGSSPAEHPIAATLRAAEEWLRDRIEESEPSRERIRRAIMDRASRDRES